LLWLYPRAWRERYGDEFVEVLGGRELLFSQVIDIVMGAVDAHLSSEARVQATAPPAPAGSEGGSSVTTLFVNTQARERQLPFETRQGAIGAIILIVGYHGLKTLSETVSTWGWTEVADFIFFASWPLVAILFFNFFILQGQPVRPRVALVTAGLGLVFAVAAALAFN